MNLFVSLWAASVTAAPPAEPLDIDDEPQFIFHNYVVDTHWVIKDKLEIVVRVFHKAN